MGPIDGWSAVGGWIGGCGTYNRTINKTKEKKKQRKKRKVIIYLTD